MMTEEAALDRKDGMEACVVKWHREYRNEMTLWLFLVMH